MRGEHCVAGASILSAMAVIMLVFVNIGQVSSGALTNGIYFAKVDVAAFGGAIQTATNTSAGGLYDTSNSAMGKTKGLRQNYRYGIYRSCGYQKDGSGVCNGTMFGYPMEPLAQILADTPSKFAKQASDIIPTGGSFKENTYNHAMTRAAGLLIFVGSCLALLALIFGVIKARLFFLVAAGSAGLSALALMIGAALWTAVVAKDNWIARVKVDHGANLGIYTTAGPSLYLTWVAFVFITLSVLPYAIACCTFRRD